MKSGLIDNSSVATIYSILGETEISIDGWARLYNGSLEIPQYLLSYFAELFNSSLVIGFEMSPLIKEVLRQLGIDYIDVVVHPVRFMDDLALSFHASSSAVSLLLENQQLQGDLVKQYAGLAAGAARRGRVEDVPENACLFIAQTTFDKSLIRDGRFVTMSDFSGIALETWDEFDDVLVKAHPLEPDAQAVNYALALSPKARLIDTSIYAVLASENLSRVSTISSGVGVEAGYFGKPTTYFLGENRNRPTASAAYFGIFHDFLNADFWREILRPLLDTTPITGLSLPFKSNRLRLSMKSAWGFQD